jgi:2,3-bisphosphoglycerate-dependent phosphoglycerate mutase
MNIQCILLRHGQSAWNKENRFTGWEDVPLSPLGVEEAKMAGQIMKKYGVIPERAFTSFLQRAIKTLWLALEESGQMHIPVEKTWRLNEKHYGALQGLNKTETAEKYGEDQVLLWRRGYSVRPPELDQNDPRHPKNQSKYAGIPATELPGTESLADTLNRMLPFWNSTIVPSFKTNRTILVAAHGNSLRGIVQHLKGLNDEEILALNIPTGIPYLFELSPDGKYISDRYLIEEEELKRRIEEVEKQGKAH